MPSCSPDTCVCKQNGSTEMAIASAPSGDSSDNGNDDSDVWGSSSPDPSMTEEVSRDMAALKRRHENRGYLDGLTKGGEVGLQAGFDTGYPLGAQLGGLIGQLVAETVWRASNGQISLQTRDAALKDLRIDKVLSSEHFDSELGLADPAQHPTILKWTRFYDDLPLSL